MIRSHVARIAWYTSLAAILVLSLIALRVSTATPDPLVLCLLVLPSFILGASITHDAMMN